jgi:hypothetical protein
MIFSFGNITIVRREDDQEHTDQHCIYALFVIQGSEIHC